MVDDKAGRGAEAAWPEPLAVAITGEDQHVRVLRGRDDLTFDPPASGLERGRPTQPRPGFREQLPGGLVRDRLQLL